MCSSESTRECDTWLDKCKTLGLRILTNRQASYHLGIQYRLHLLPKRSLLHLQNSLTSITQSLSIVKSSKALKSLLQRNGDDHEDDKDNEPAGLQ
jgi:hypothetical protein